MIKIDISGNDKHSFLARNEIARPADKDIFDRKPEDIHLLDDFDSNIDIPGYVWSRPMQAITIVDWDVAMEIWNRKVNFDGITGGIFSIGVGAPKSVMLQFIECFMEDRKLARFMLKSQSILSLYASGRTDGLTVDVGFDTTEITPIMDSKIIREKSRILPGAEEHATKLFQRNFGIELSRSSILADILVDRVKEMSCYIDDRGYSL